jgi:hypothetical protein
VAVRLADSGAYAARRGRNWRVGAPVQAHAFGGATTSGITERERGDLVESLHETQGRSPGDVVCERTHPVFLFCRLDGCRPVGRSYPSDRLAGCDAREYSHTSQDRPSSTRPTETADLDEFAAARPPERGLDQAPRGLRIDG